MLETISQLGKLYALTKHCLRQARSHLCPVCCGPEYAVACKQGLNKEKG